MDKIWYILIDQKEEGPYSVKELMFDSRITLETLVWKEGFPDWVPLKRVNELKRLFEVRKPPDKDKENEAKLKGICSQSELALDYSPEPNLLLLLLLIAILLACYLFYRTY